MLVFIKLWHGLIEHDCMIEWNGLICL